MSLLSKKLSIVFCAVSKTYCGVKESQNANLCVKSFK